MMRQGQSGGGFGFLANRVRKSKLDLCRTLLAAPLPAAPSHSESGEVNENSEPGRIPELIFKYFELVLKL